MDEEVCLLLCMEIGKKLVFASARWQCLLTFGLRSRDDVTMHEICLRQRDNSRSLERCFVALCGICHREMLVGGTAEVQVRDSCTLTVEEHSTERIGIPSTKSMSNLPEPVGRRGRRLSGKASLRYRSVCI